ncbi:MAG: MoxR family ATPase [Nannocystaceae bacterium]|nr:MoxR family ATPase [Nannocystaceae bacterium]
MATAAAIRKAVGCAIVGKDEIIDLALVALLSGGHLLLEDMPGVGKSTLARSLAGAVGGVFRRIQFTADLLPADVLGVNVWRPQRESFEFREGPLFANFVLADEVNRAPPRTQSALLEAMGEHQISVDGVSRPLPEPFMVIATQNPLEHYGTYPLPESQRDRFGLRLSMGYVTADVEASLLQGNGTRPTTEAVVSAADVLAAQRAAKRVFVHADLATYAQAVVQATREHPRARLGVSTRGALAWVAAARARALLEGREQVSLDDLQELAIAALAHRVLPGLASDEASASSEELIREVTATVPVPQ